MHTLSNIYIYIFIEVKLKSFLLAKWDIFLQVIKAFILVMENQSDKSWCII